MPKTQPIDFRAAVLAAWGDRPLQQLSDGAGVHYASVHRWLRSGGGVNAETLARVLDYLGIGLTRPSRR